VSRRLHPVAAARLLVIALIAMLASAAGGAFAARAVGAQASSAAAQVLGELPQGLGLALANLSTSRLKIAKKRAERRLIDFVELMWPVLDPGQPFVRTWVQEAICAHLEAISAGRLTKLLINVPPGFTKSRLVNVMWPAWEWGPKDRPDLRYMAWSYDARLSEDQNNDCRKVIESEVYQLFWGSRFSLLGDSNAKSYYKNDKGGWRRSSSIGGAGTGYRADRLLTDDPHNVRDADSMAALKEATTWFAKSLPTRVRNASGDVRVRVPFWVRAVHGKGLEDDPDDNRPVTVSATIVIMQRVHLHDISGVIMKNPALGYEVLLIEMRYRGENHPARKSEHWKGSSIGYADPRIVPGQLADPIRFPEHVVAAMEAQMMLDGGSDAVAAQFDQWPLEVSGSWFKVEWLPVIEPHEVPTDVSIGKRGFDFASSAAKKSDQTADARVGRGASDRKFYLWDTHAIRGGPGDVEGFIRQRHTDDPQAVEWSIPEDPGTGKLYADYVIRELSAGRYVSSSREEKDKVTRAKPVSAQAQHGNFVIVNHPGWELARAELVDFPYGDHDDLVDAISRAFAAEVAMPATPTEVGGWTVDRAAA